MNEQTHNKKHIKAQKNKHINFDAQQNMMALNDVAVGSYTSSCQTDIQRYTLTQWSMKVGNFQCYVFQMDK